MSEAGEKPRDAHKHIRLRNKDDSSLQLHCTWCNADRCLFSAATALVSAATSSKRLPRRCPSATSAKRCCSVRGVCRVCVCEAGAVHRSVKGWEAIQFNLGHRAQRIKLGTKKVDRAVKMSG